MTLGSRPSFSCRSALGLVPFVLVSSICAAAGADELPLTLRYRAPSQCPSLEALNNAVRRLATKQTQPYSASVTIESDEQRFTAQITASDGTERTLVGDSCEEVAEATAVVLALAISPSSPAPEARTGLKPAQYAAAPAPKPPHVNRSPSELVQLKLGAAAVLDWGTLPHVDLGAAARVGVTARTWSAALDATHWLLQERRRLSQNTNFSGDFSWWALLATGCVAPRDGSPRLELCAGPELGHLAGHGLGVTSQKEASTFRFGFQALAEIQVPLSSRFRVRAGLGAAAVLLGRRSFQLDGANLYLPPVFSGRAALGSEFLF